MQLHPAVHAQWGDDAAHPQVDTHHGWPVVLDAVVPCLGPQLAQEWQLLPAYHAGVPGGCHLVDAAGPPVVHVDPEHGRSDVDPGMVIEQVPTSGLVHQLRDPGAVPRQDDTAQVPVLSTTAVKPR